MRSQGDEGKYMLKITDDLLDDLIVEEELQLVYEVPLRYTIIGDKTLLCFQKDNCKCERRRAIHN